MSSSSKLNESIDKLGELIGAINNKEPKQYVFHVDSTDRIDFDNTSDSSFFQSIPNIKYYTHVSLLSFTCSKSYYTISAPYNTFTINGTLITLPSQNYSFNAFPAFIKPYLDGAGYGTWTITANKLTGKLTFTTDYVGSITFAFGNDKVISRVVGLPNTITFTTTTTSVNTCDFQRTTMLYLTTNLIDGDADRMTLHAIHNSGQDFGKIIFINPCPNLTKVPMNKTTDTPKFDILDDNLNSLDLNGNQVIMSLLFTE